jgi:uncharacterized cupin superfamily protein
VSGDANVFADGADFTLPSGVSLTTVGKNAGADLLGATIYDLPPGARWADLHVHYANGELIVVLAGEPTLYTAEGGRRLVTGKVVACLRGYRGAHRLENQTDEPRGC